MKLTRRSRRRKIKLGWRVWHVSWSWFKRPRVTSRKTEVGPYSHSERHGHRLKLPSNPFWRYLEWRKKRSTARRRKTQ